MDCLYYTDGLIADRKTLTKLCIFFDTTKTFYLLPTYYLKPLEERWLNERDLPFFSKSPCEKELLTRVHSDAYQVFIDENHELINSKVLQPFVIKQKPPDWENFETNEKKLMNKGAGIAFGVWGESVGLIPNDKIYIDSPWFSLYRWQSIAGALHFAIQNEYIPISDNAPLSSLACETVSRFSDLKHQPTPNEIASHIAFRSMSLLIPDFPSLKPEEILEVREKLADELQYFKIEMQRISKDIEEYPDIDSIVINEIQPRLDDLELKIKSLKDNLFRRIAESAFAAGSATPLLSHFLNLPLSIQLICIASFTGKTLVDIHKNQSEQYEVRNQSVNRGLVFLLDMKRKYK